VGRDAITGLVVLAASLALFWATLGLERHPMVPVGPGFYPRIVLGVTAATALLLVVLDVLARRRAVPAVRAGGQHPNFRLVLLVYGVFAAYVIALPWLGFRVATLAFLVAMPAVLDLPRTPRKWAGVAVLAVATTAATYIIFESYLHVLLPRGLWTGF
jgi:putative tricarboxylic transport membrane protein